MATSTDTIVYFQPRLSAGLNYRNGEGREQIWCPWWALLLHQHAEAAGVKGILVDARRDEGWRAQLGSNLSPASVLAISVLTGHAIRDAIEASEIAKSCGALVVWGGPHATLFPVEVSQEAFVDHVIAGYGGSVFGRMVAAMRDGVTIPSVIDARGSRGQAVTIRRGPIVSSTFKPTLGLVADWSQYTNADQAIGVRAVNIVTSEGCLRNCTYCSEPATSDRSWLTYDVEDCALAAHSVISGAGADSIKLHDPNFLHDRARGLRFARALSSARVPWAATLHPADLLDLGEDDLGELAACGLRRVLVGLESPVKELVKLAGKAYDTDRTVEMAEKLARHRIAGMFTFIVGWPGAETDHYGRTIDEAFTLRAVWSGHQAKIHFLEPWPGTPIFNLISRSGGLPSRSLIEWAEIDYYFAHHQGLHDPTWEQKVREANAELSPYVEA
ncbi:radical SAM protein [Accumulibacter sp.]|uniref:B12-binding domain-containing radical SAM protein n=1 Tax=Accumulibacter sp. TaxID=2053492 RepID=UPI0035B33944